MVLVDQVMGALQYPCSVVSELRLFGRIQVTFIVKCSVLAGECLFCFSCEMQRCKLVGEFRKADIAP